MLLEGSNQNYYSYLNDPFTKIWINFKGVLSREIINIYGLFDTVFSNELGFSDPHHFSYQFQKRMGMSLPHTKKKQTNNRWMNRRLFFHFIQISWNKALCHAF